MNADKRTTELAVLFADISDSTRMYDTLGDARAKTVVDECIRVMRDIVGHHAGRASSRPSAT
jgi:class 3 adenylate cyclase